MADISRRTEKAFDSAAELTKQIITVATAVVAFTATVFSSFKTLTRGQLLLLACAWAAYVLSILLGFLTIRHLASALQANDSETSPPSIHAGRMPAYSLAQGVAFVLATLGIAVVGLWALYP